MTAVEAQLAKKLNVSTKYAKNKLDFNIHYHLKIKVWHKSWNDFAGKREETIPITLFADPNDAVQPFQNQPMMIQPGMPHQPMPV